VHLWVTWTRTHEFLEFCFLYLDPHRYDYVIRSGSAAQVRRYLQVLMGHRMKLSYSTSIASLVVSAHFPFSRLLFSLKIAAISLCGMSPGNVAQDPTTVAA